MRIAGEPAYVLHHRAYSETSLLLEVFTRQHGRLGLIAKGARSSRSPLRGLLAPFQPLLLSFSGKGELPVVTGAEPEGIAHALAGEGLYCGFYLNELMMRLTARYDAHERLFDVYRATLAGLVAGGDASPVLRIFEKNLLGEVGYGLMLDCEAAAGPALVPDGQYDYRPELGPIVIKDSTPDAPITGVRVSGVTLIALARERFDDAASLREARTLLRACLARHLGERPLESRRLMQAVRGALPVTADSE